MKHYGFDGDEELPQNLAKEDLQHHITKRNIDYELYGVHYPIIGRNGVPLEPIEVRRAREQHLRAHEIAKERQYHPHYHEGDEESAYASNLVQ